MPLILDYAFGTMPLRTRLAAGSQFPGCGTLLPPGVTRSGRYSRPPHRRGRAYDGLQGYDRVMGMSANYEKALALNPWLFAYLGVLCRRSAPAAGGGSGELVTLTGEVLTLHPDYAEIYTLLALSGGGPIGVFGEFDGAVFSPLSVVSGGGLVQGLALTL